MAVSRNSTTETEFFVQLLLQSTSENRGEDNSAMIYRGKGEKIKSKGGFTGKENHRGVEKKREKLASDVNT